jgi:hypothetical protein
VSKRIRNFIIILVLVLFATGNYTVSAYAKGLSKAVKKEYVKILKDILDKEAETEDVGDKPYFIIADINADGKKDLLVGYFGSYADRRSAGDGAVYINKNNKAIKTKFYYVSDIGEKALIDDAMWQNDYLSYKNYLMIPFYSMRNDTVSNHEVIYKLDKKGIFTQIYHRIEQTSMLTDETIENTCTKLADGKPKEISVEEYDKFASKFKKINGGWNIVTLDNIKKYVK